MPTGQAGGHQAVGQMLALGIHPVPPRGPIIVPEGSRSGSFAAGPDGKPGASGSPEVKGGGTASDGGSGTGAHSSSPLSGITVERGPVAPSGNVVVAAKAAPQSSAPPLMASLKHPSIAELARSTRAASLPDAPATGIEGNVFGAKRSYRMMLNMPNLTSAKGSWIIRFAELHTTAGGELTPPVAIHKVDPAYAGDLVREHIEGTVVLYAVIHADGTVGDVRVLQGVDDRLDENARAALMKWRFRPGVKNGSPVEIEAVVRIPFATR